MEAAVTSLAVEPEVAAHGTRIGVSQVLVATGVDKVGFSRIKKYTILFRKWRLCIHKIYLMLVFSIQYFSKNILQINICMCLIRKNYKYKWERVE